MPFLPPSNISRPIPRPIGRSDDSRLRGFSPSRWERRRGCGSRSCSVGIANRTRTRWWPYPTRFVSGRARLETGRQKKFTHADKTPHPRPQAVVGQLSPPSRVGHSPLIEDASDQVYQHGNEEDDGKYAPRPDAAGLMGLSAGTGVLRPHLEEVCAFVGVHADKGCRGTGVDRVPVAEERDSRRLPPLGIRRRSGYATVAVVAVLVILVPRSVMDRVPGIALLSRAARRAAGVLKDELPSAGD